MTTESSSPAGLSDLIKSYKAQPEKTGNALVEKLMDLLTDPKVRNKIAAAAGTYAHQISIDLADLVEEVRQEAIAACLAKFRDAEFKFFQTWKVPSMCGMQSTSQRRHWWTDTWVAREQMVRGAPKVLVTPPSNGERRTPTLPGMQP
ncbi:hypothetical protein [Marinobacter nauticus]|uniref:Uncharacterized protein n=1 Tax=Marinobacter nauticus TaxID=2743 RepID=A0A1M2UXH7_MARNT|nr:hypothetical protein [Marinobacter nauticus]OJS99982.1 hypothetical protein BEE62_07670 [Marinobacter nauticus]